MEAGKLTYRFHLQRRAADENGDRLGVWTTEATVWANIRFLRGSEPVIAQRLQGVQPAVITVRTSTLSRQVDNSWRAVDARSNQVWAIQTAIPTDDRAWIEITATSGRASDA